MVRGISFVWVRKLVGKGSLVFLDHLRDVSVEYISIELVSVVSNFRMCFLQVYWVCQFR